MVCTRSCSTDVVNIYRCVVLSDWRKPPQKGLLMHCLQALARGYLARCVFRRLIAERKAIEDAALAVIKPWAHTAVDRLRFLRLRCNML